MKADDRYPEFVALAADSEFSELAHRVTKESGIAINGDGESIDTIRFLAAICGRMSDIIETKCPGAMAAIDAHECQYTNWWDGSEIVLP